MKILILNLKKEYFEQIKSGEKKEEYREIKKYWIKRLSKNYDEVHIKLGYPKKEDKDKVLKFKYNGFVKKIIKHEMFGEKEVLVFSIPLVERRWKMKKNKKKERPTHKEIIEASAEKLEAILKTDFPLTNRQRKQIKAEIKRKRREH